jgi:cell wall assembly regulator SMI1
MCILIEELQFIWGWLGEINPDPDLYDFQCYRPGLSHEKIAWLTKDLPFTLPEELYQLYQWKDGVDDRHGYLNDTFLFKDQVYYSTSLDFYPLKTAIQIYQRLSQLGQSIKGTAFEFWNDNWFPIAGFEGDTYLYIDCNSNPSPVVQWHAENTPAIARTYKSLTAMISVIAECCEMDVYQIIPNEYAGEDHVRIVIDETKRGLENEIFQKYNT